MRILLIVSPYYYSHPFALKTELLGVLYLTSSLRANGHRVLVIDPTIERPQRIDRKKYYYGISEKQLKGKIRSFNPEVVGISCHYAYSHREAYKIASIAKDIKSDIVTVMGGLYVSVYQEKVLSDCKSIDYALIGESEESLLELLREISLKASLPRLDKIDGLLYRNGAETIKNEKKHFIDNLDSLPFPARDSVDIKRYMNNGSILYGLGNKPTLSLLTSRSCSNRCSFCNMKLVHGPRWRARSPDNVLYEIDEIVNKHRARHVFVMDDNFTFNPERVKSICEKIIQKGYRFCWNTPNGISVRKIDLELAKLMKRSGCTNVCIAIESGNEYIRNEVINKNISNEEIVNAIKHFNSAKIPVGAFVVLGMPGERKQHFQETVRLVKRLKLSFIVVTFATPFKGTELYNNLIHQGILKDDFLVEMDNEKSPVFSTGDFSKEELLRWRKKIYVEFYMSRIPRIVTEFLGGRLNWISISTLKRVLKEPYERCVHS